MSTDPNVVSLSVDDLTNLMDVFKSLAKLAETFTPDALDAKIETLLVVFDNLKQNQFLLMLAVQLLNSLLKNPQVGPNDINIHVNQAMQSTQGK